MKADTIATNNVSAGQSLNPTPRRGGPQNGLFAKNAIWAVFRLTCWIVPEVVKIVAALVGELPKAKLTRSARPDSLIELRSPIVFIS